jgi:hypothetical protein
MEDERVEHQVFVVALEEDPVGILLLPGDEVVEDLLRVRATVNIVAQEDDRILRRYQPTIAHQRVHQAGQLCEMAVDVTYGEDPAHGVPMRGSDGSAITVNGQRDSGCWGWP